MQNDLSTVYYPEFFIPSDLEDAKNIILTHETVGTDYRWQSETKWISNVLTTHANINEDSTVLDWGCGIGRLSKVLIETFGCRVLGVDLQPKMLDYAIQYVNSNRFDVMPYNASFASLPLDFFTHALGVWVFQHSPYIQYEIPLVYRALKNKGGLFVVENISKAIPNKAMMPNERVLKFYDDGVSTKPLLDQLFDTEIYGKLPEEASGLLVREHSWWSYLIKKEN